MGMVISTLAALSTFHPEANPALSGQGIYKQKEVRNKQIHRLLGILPTVAGNSYRHRIGRKFNTPQKGLSYVEVKYSNGIFFLLINNIRIFFICWID